MRQVLGALAAALAFDVRLWMLAPSHHPPHFSGAITANVEARTSFRCERRTGIGRLTLSLRSHAPGATSIAFSMFVLI